ncbi:hypothetical protein MGYG_08283 [Nannizzia gypsea CBS 118893]|uniref:Uncharacterized protein n=1 Tax=Arthroderma gypseum (strain ATCC MYA-4604 / CBS 118893) TaxID=535722 RepID=E4V689_ARTGP|nr:hypothetical protein MGYG_08283 [Nannizzia gypsea CBS 118893]EFR05272.1 hypothetical protein MGYG_08283 [Nannizzia gypsea CBS 118893]
MAAKSSKEPGMTEPQAGRPGSSGGRLNDPTIVEIKPRQQENGKVQPEPEPAPKPPPKADDQPHNGEPTDPDRRGGVPTDRPQPHGIPDGHPYDRGIRVTHVCCEAEPSSMGGAWFSSRRSNKSREQAMEQEIHQLRSEIGRQRQVITELQEGNAFTKDENFHLRGKIRELNGLIRRTQERAFGEIGQGKWASQPDRDIRDDLALFQRQLRDWSKEYALDSISTLQALKMSEEEKDEFLCNLSKVVTLSENGSIPATLRTGKMERRLPSILVNALIAHDVYTQIFDDPFYFLGQSTGLDDQDCSVDGTPLVNETLNRIYGELINLDEREAHIWRSQLLRVYNPPEGGVLSEKEKLAAKRCIPGSNGAVITLQHLHTGQQNTSFGRSPVIRKQLVLINYETSSQMLSQNLPSLKLEQFKVSSQSMEAHPSQGLDDDEISRIHPALLAFGNDDCENYHIARVWAKAVVLLRATR